MPIFSKGQINYKPTRNVEFVWDTFRKGLNTLLRENEVDAQELTQADNIILKGKGIPTKRWGTSIYYTAGNATGSVRGLKGFYKSDGTNELLAITDDGYLTKKNGTSFSTLTGASWASGYNVEIAQLSDKAYIVNGQRELVRYSSPTLVGFPTIAIPVFTGATNLSNATGGSTKAYVITAVSQVGETLPSANILLPNQPDTLGGVAGGTVRLTWTGVSTASGILQGYNIYGRVAGSERFIAGVGPSVTTYDDSGGTQSEFTFAPTADSTGGPKAKYIKRFQDRLILAGIDGEPSKLIISGREPNHEKFDLANGGNILNIEKNSGDPIVQIEIFRDKIIVFKQKSIWQVTLGLEQIENFFITTPNLQLITNSYGCIAPRSVVAVENDLYFLSRTGVNTLGYQTGYAFDLLRSNEISLKVRTFFEGLTVSQKMNAVATYFNKKYIIAFPGLNKSMVFDTERGAWVGPWTVDAQVFEIYEDSDSNQHLLLGHDDSVAVDEMADSYTTDNGAAIATTLKTRQEDFGDWSLFKNIRNLFVQFRNITGNTNVDIRLEERNGLTVTARSFNVIPNTGDSGWGADLWGSALWGSSNVAGGTTDSSQQVIKWRELNKTARTIQMTIKTSNTGDNFELLGIRGDAKPQGKGITPSSWRE